MAAPRNSLSSVGEIPAASPSAVEIGTCSNPIPLSARTEVAAIDSKGRVVYIGKAKCLRTRLLSYFRANSRHPKAGKILRNTRVLVWEETADEFAALLRELELIRHFRPRFNVLGMPGQRRYIYLCLGRSARQLQTGNTLPLLWRTVSCRQRPRGPGRRVRLNPPL